MNLLRFLTRLPIQLFLIKGSLVPPPPGFGYRITEDSKYRITENGHYRVIETVGYPDYRLDESGEIRSTEENDYRVTQD